MNALTADQMLGRPPDRMCRPRTLNVLLTTVSSDSHTWNLIFLQLFFEYLGHTVKNLGACTPDELIAQNCKEKEFDLLVVSTVNGHGRVDGERLMRRLQSESDAPVAVIGGKLSTSGAIGQVEIDALLQAGFAAVFDAATSMPVFEAFVAGISVGRPAARALERSGEAWP